MVTLTQAENGGSRSSIAVMSVMNIWEGKKKKQKWQKVPQFESSQLGFYTRIPSSITITSASATKVQKRLDVWGTALTSGYLTRLTAAVFWMESSCLWCRSLISPALSHPGRCGSEKVQDMTTKPGILTQLLLKVMLVGNGTCV